MKLRHILFSLITLLSAAPAMRGQDVAIKTNLIYDALLTPNVAVEVGLAPKWTLDMSAAVNNWAVDDHRWKQWHFQPEARYWFCQRFAGHFVGAHLIGGQYNFGNLNNSIKFLGTDFSDLSHHRYQGWMAGAGVAYGYSWILSRHWNLEAEIGLGWIYTRSDVFNCSNCGKKVRANVPHNYVGPTKAALNIIYAF